MIFLACRLPDRDDDAQLKVDYMLVARKRVTPWAVSRRKIEWISSAE
jgi:hypothetical protein